MTLRSLVEWEAAAQRFIVQAVSSTGDARATTLERAVAFRATEVVAAFEAGFASAGGAALTEDERSVAAIALCRVVRVTAAARIAFIGQANAAASAECAARFTGAKAAGAALAAATFEPVRAFVPAAAIAFFDDHATELAATGFSV